MSDTLARLAISQSELFSGWPKFDLERLISKAELVTIEPGTCVHRGGDPAEYLCVLAAGSMKMTRDTPSGRQFVAGIHLPGEFHGLGPVLAQTPHIFTAECEERTMLVRIPAEFLRYMLGLNGRLAFPLVAALQRRYVDALDHFHSAAVKSSQARIAELLRSIDARRARGRVGTEIKLSQDEIAAMLGTRRQVVNRALRTMAARGAIRVQYGRIEIVDAEKLTRISLDAD
jgi:CRP-like cAMP-binding protein